MSQGPCMCGATDCPRCYPQNFIGHGAARRYRWAECAECGEEWDPDDLDSDGRCEDCRLVICPRCEEAYDPHPDHECPECGAKQPTTI